MPRSSVPFADVREERDKLLAAVLSAKRNREFKCRCSDEISLSLVSSPFHRCPLSRVTALFYLLPTSFPDSPSFSCFAHDTRPIPGEFESPLVSPLFICSSSSSGSDRVFIFLPPVSFAQFPSIAPIMLNREPFLHLLAETARLFMKGRASSIDVGEEIEL